MHSLENTAGDISLFVNAGKTEFWGDVNIRIGKAWGALDGLNVIWKSDLPHNLKRDFFRAIVESVLLYGSSSWALTKCLESKWDSTYTRMLRAILNISRKQHPTKQRLDDNLPAISHVSGERQLDSSDIAGEEKRSSANILLWAPKHGHTRLGFINQLVKTLNVYLKACRLRWVITMGGEKESEESMHTRIR